MDLSGIVITTDRLKLVPLSEKYAQDIFKELTPEVTTYMFPRSPQKIEETLEYINSQISKIKSGEEMPVVILDKNSGEFLGGGGAHKLSTNTPELGIWIKKSAHGHKFGLEAVVGLKNWIEKNIQFEYIIYPVDRQNIASVKIAEFIGGIVEKEYQKPNASGKMLDLIEYRIYKK